MVLGSSRREFYQPILINTVTLAKPRGFDNDSENSVYINDKHMTFTV